MQLSKELLPQIAARKIHTPVEDIFSLPEKMLQFGTGVLLRGLCDYQVDVANQEGRFNGRIVVVKSTASGDADAFKRQDNLYTVCVRGINNNVEVRENRVCASISRVLVASTHWKDVLELAGDPALNVVISNTTEVGLQLTWESIFQDPPSSYPAKLLAFLYRRYLLLETTDDGRIVVVPTELITGNGDKLKEIVKELAAFNHLDEAFLRWLETHVRFCNSLVDRIVTKDPGEEIMEGLQKELGYKDDLLTMCEDYHLWAIEGDDYVASVLSFAKEGSGAFVKPDIGVFRALKLHLLNGTHTLSAPTAFLAGFDTVKDAMQHPVFRLFVEKLMLSDISPAMPYSIAKGERTAFGRKVIDRFSNPYLRHQWLNITLQQTTKMRMRNLPVIVQYRDRLQRVPPLISAGFAAYILFMRPVREDHGAYYGDREGKAYRINDDHAAFFSHVWKNSPHPAQVVSEILQNKIFWEEDLSNFDAFRVAVTEDLTKMMQQGVMAALENKLTQL